MLTQSLKVKHTVTYHAQPLLCIDNLPGEGAELSPTAARQLAAALTKAADDCELALIHTRGNYGPVSREYILGA